MPPRHLEIISGRTCDFAHHAECTAALIVNKNVRIYESQIVNRLWLAFLWSLPICNHDNLVTSLLINEPIVNRHETCCSSEENAPLQCHGLHLQLIQCKGREVSKFQFSQAHRARTQFLDKKGVAHFCFTLNLHLSLC